LPVLYRVPSPVLLVVALVVSVAVVAYLQRTIHRRFREVDFEEHNQVGGFIITIAGTLYAVVLGFLTVVVWQQYQDAAQRVSSESAAVSDAWHTAVGLPPAVRSPLRHDVFAYANEMLQNEWPLMREGRFSIEGDRLIMEMTGIVGSYVPKNLGEATAQSATMQSLVAVHDARLRRLSSNETGMSWLEWAVLGIGALVVIGFCSLFGMRNNRTHTIMTSSVTVIIMTMIVMIFELQYPFRSDLGIAPNAWVGLIRHIDYMDGASPANMRM
jgi:hypothetical protein